MTNQTKHTKGGKKVEICPKTYSGRHIWGEQVYEWKKGDIPNSIESVRTLPTCQVCGMVVDKEL